MTDEEINRKFDVVAEHLATMAVGLERLAEGQRQTDASVRSLLAITEIQAQEIKELSESVRAVDGRQRAADERQRAADERQRAADERGRRTDERLDALINTVERYISGRRNGKRPGESEE